MLADDSPNDVSDHAKPIQISANANLALAPERIAYRPATTGAATISNSTRARPKATSLGAPTATIVTAPTQSSPPTSARNVVGATVSRCRRSARDEPNPAARCSDTQSDTHSTTANHHLTRDVALYDTTDVRLLCI